MLWFALLLAGAVALLLWAVRMIRTGMERGFAVPMRRWLRQGAAHPLRAAASGAAAALLLQSATAVAVLVGRFASSGTLAVAAGLAILLGADFGSAVAARILLLPVEMAVPLLLLAGVSAFLRGTRPEVRQAGRMAVGVALVLVALGMIRDATGPLRENGALGDAMAYLASDPFSAFALGALFAWAVHSSIAAVLLVVTLAAQGVLPVPAAAVLVLGANLGGAVIPLVLSLGAERPSRQIAEGNLLLRGAGALLALWAIWVWPEALLWLGASPASQLIHLHLGLNLALIAVGLPLVPAVLRLLDRIVPEPKGSADLAASNALDPTALATPRRALASASREVLRTGEAVEAMLRPALQQYRSWDDARARAILAREDDVDRMHFETKLYLSKLQGKGLDPADEKGRTELATIAGNFEAAGDAVSQTLLRLAERMRRERLTFSEGGWAELFDFHDRVLSNAQLALDVLMTGDVDTARQLLAEKDRVREVERELSERHLERLQAGDADSVETSNIHQETVRALKLVNTCFAAVAYPILRASGDLLDSRLTGAAEPEEA